MSLIPVVVTNAALYDYANRPNWIAVVNIRSLEAFIQSITNVFTKIKTQHVRTFLRPRSKTGNNNPKAT